MALTQVSLEVLDESSVNTYVKHQGFQVFTPLADSVLTEDDFGKIVADSNATANVIYTLPASSAGTAGKTITFLKTKTFSVTVRAVGVDSIMDSAIAGDCVCSGPAPGSLTLISMPGRWMIQSGAGTWVTT